LYRFSECPGEGEKERRREGEKEKRREGEKEQRGRGEEGERGRGDRLRVTHSSSPFPLIPLFLLFTACRRHLLPCESQWFSPRGAWKLVEVPGKSEENQEAVFAIHTEPKLCGTRGRHFLDCRLCAGR
jgi:hypothetical protein